MRLRVGAGVGAREVVEEVGLPLRLTCGQSQRGERWRACSMAAAGTGREERGEGRATWAGPTMAGEDRGGRWAGPPAVRAVGCEFFYIFINSFV